MSTRALTLWLLDTADPVALLRGSLDHDVVGAQTVAQQIYGGDVAVPVAATDLAHAMSASDSKMYVGAFPGATVISCPMFAAQRPSTLTAMVATLSPAGTATLLYTEPDEALGVFARWEGGELRRSFAADPVDIFEDSGLPFVFEASFWGGEHPLQYAPGVAPQPLALPFHPAQLAEQANREWLGFRFTPPYTEADTDPQRIPVTAFAIQPAGYQPTEADHAAYQASLDRGRPAASAASAAADDAESAPAESVWSAEQPPRRAGRLRRYFGFGG